MTATTLDRHAFHGQWKRRGMIHVPVVVDEPDEDEVAGQMLVGVLTALTSQQAYTVNGCACDDCGCLLKPGELCPACVIPWCRSQEIRHLNERRMVA